jgi:hypothetical protein
MRPAAPAPPAEAAGDAGCSCSPSSSSPAAAPTAGPSPWPAHVPSRRRHALSRLLAAAGAAPLAALALVVLLLSSPALTPVAAARPGRPDGSVGPAAAALRSLLAAPAASAPAPALPADVRDRLAKANAVLALRKAGLLPGNARLPASLQAKTVDAVNAAAPAYDIPGLGKARPVLTQQVGGGDGGGGAAASAAVAGAPAASPAKKWGPPPGWLATAPSLAPRRGWDAGPAAPTDPIRAPAGVNATGPLADLMAAAAASASPAAAPSTALQPHDKALDGRVQSNALIGELGGLGADQSTGSVIQMLGGFRIATPWFGTGFNFCVDRYFGSFPKVGIVIPNAAAWLLPDLAAIFGDDPLHATVNLPSPGAGLPKDARAEPTSDGFVIWMPSTQPLYISNFGFRYSLQVAQLFGVDFGFGILKIGCRVDFVRV